MSAGLKLGRLGRSLAYSQSTASVLAVRMLAPKAREALTGIVRSDRLRSASVAVYDRPGEYRAYLDGVAGLGDVVVEVGRRVEGGFRRSVAKNLG